MAPTGCRSLAVRSHLRFATSLWSLHSTGTEGRMCGSIRCRVNMAIWNSLGGEFVFVQEAAESIASPDVSVAGRRADRGRLRGRRLVRGGGGGAGEGWGWGRHAAA